MISTSPGKNRGPFPRYIEIGRISVVDDYVSRRLLILHTAAKSDKSSKTSLDFLKVVYVKAMDTSKFVAVLVENTQN